MSKIQKHIKIWKSKSLINFVEFCLKAYFALYLCTKQAAKSYTLANHAEKLKRHANWSITGQKVQTGHSVSSWLELAAQSSREAKPPASSVLEKLTLRIPNTHKYKYPTYPRNIESFQREYWERNPREKQDWLIHNLHIETLQIPLLSPSPLLYPWEIHCQNLFPSYPHLWEGHLVLGKQLERDQFHIGWCYGL